MASTKIFVSWSTFWSVAHNPSVSIISTGMIWSSLSRFWINIGFFSNHSPFVQALVVDPTLNPLVLESSTICFNFSGHSSPSNCIIRLSKYDLPVLYFPHIAMMPISESNFERYSFALMSTSNLSVKLIKGMAKLSSAASIFKI